MPGRIIEETPVPSSSSSPPSPPPPPLLPSVTQPAEPELDHVTCFPPVSKDHILHCSYDYWFPKYRTSCIRSRIIHLTPDFVSYLREDGIILADDNDGNEGRSPGGDDAREEDDNSWEPSFDTSAFRPPGRDAADEYGDAESESESESDSDEPRPLRLPPNRRFPDLHRAINDAIADLGGAAAPKLNWSSPKDATWISRHPNTVKCTSADDVYMLLKSSSFASHDLDHAFDDTVDEVAASAAAATTTTTTTTAEAGSDADAATAPATQANGYPPAFQPILVLRAFFSPLPSLEFRCFVKARQLVALCQRDLNHYPFLRRLRPAVAARAAALFAARLRDSFPDPDFVFDVYIPEATGYASSDSDSDNSDGDDGTARAERREQARLGRARLIDINPWASRTDPLLFDWAELLAWTIRAPAREPEVVRVPFVPASALLGRLNGDSDVGLIEDRLRELGLVNGRSGQGGRSEEGEDDKDEYDDSDDDGDDEPEVRLIEIDDPAAYNFSSPQYSAHKLPMEVVHASAAGQGGMMEFARRWQRITGGGRT